MKATKILALLMAVVMVFALAACAKTDPTPLPRARKLQTTPRPPGPPLPAETTGSDEILPAFGKKASDIGVVLVVNTNLGDHAICDLSNEGPAGGRCQIRLPDQGRGAGRRWTLQVPTFTEYAEDPR